MARLRILPLALAASLAAAAPLASQARARPTADRNGQDLPSLAIEELTWTEIRDAIAAGRTAVIVPIGGTEQNGPHMVMGKHNYIVGHAARVIAERLGTALVAPTLQFVPEGDYNRPGFGDKPGVISNPSPSYEAVLDAAARSLQAHGFTDILFIGDSGGNQAGMQAVAEKLNAEWAGTGARVYALDQYYNNGLLRQWLKAELGYTDEQIGSHAGITDTSQILYVFPQGIRNDRRMPFGGSPDAGVSGDPTRASVEIGRMGVEFKVISAIAQYQALKNPAEQQGRGRRGG